MSMDKKKNRELIERKHRKDLGFGPIH